MLYEKPCGICGKIFLANPAEERRGNSKYCSRKCSGINKQRQCEDKRKNRQHNKKCAYCGKSFYAKESRNKHGFRFCCRLHKDLAQRIGGIKEIQPPHYGDEQKDYRAIAFRVYPKKCNRCSFDKHSAAIVVHHKDRNRENNDIQNLEVLCANCHAIEHWGSSSNGKTSSSQGENLSSILSEST